MVLHGALIALCGLIGLRWRAAEYSVTFWTTEPMQALISFTRQIEFDPQRSVVGKVVGAPLPKSTETCLLIAVRYT